MQGTSAVGWAKKIVFPTRAVSWTAGSFCLPRRICCQQHRPSEASILVARDAVRAQSRSLPIQLSLAQAKTGIFGFAAPRSDTQSQNAHVKPRGSPTRAQDGLSAPAGSLG